MSNAQVTQLLDSDALADFGKSPSGRIRVVRAPGALGINPLMVVHDIAPWATSESRRKAETAQRILQSSEITHPAWVRTFGAVMIEQHPGLATELVAGCALTELRLHTVSLGMVSHIAAQVAGLLESLHRGRDTLGRPRRLVHGSVTPDKVMLSFAGDVKVLDFGVARTSARALGRTEQWPEELQPFLSPEMVAGEPATATSDLYMLGATLYFMLTGHAPYPVGQTFKAEAWQRLAPPSSLRAGVAPSLDALVMGLLDPDPHQRPVSAQEVRDRLTAGPARTALATLVRDAVPEHFHWLESLYEPQALRPLRATVPKTIPDDEAPTEIPLPRHLVRAHSQKLIAAPKQEVALVHVPKPQGLVPHVEVSQALEPAPSPLQHIGHDSIAVMRKAVQQLFNESGPEPAPSTKPDRAKGHAARPAPLPIPVAAPTRSWRRPLGLVMALSAALLFTFAIEIEEPPGVIDLRVQPMGAKVEIAGHPYAGRRSELPAGFHRVRVSAEHFKESNLMTALEPGEHRVIVLSLAPQTGDGAPE